MVVNRSGTMVHPCIKEGVLPAPLRSVTRRVHELPSLRYGPIGNSTLKSGPLRVTNTYNYETIPRNSTRKQKELSYSSDDLAFKTIKPARRVRFDLPPSESDAGIRDANDGGVVKHTAGDGPLRTRASVSQRSDIQKHQHLDNHRPEYTRVNNNTTFYDYNTIDASVAVAVSPAPRYRVHPTGRYIRGTLSPTSNSAAPAAASPGGIALLRAARDGDDVALRDILRRALVVGIPEADLNAIDNSGRTALSYIGSNGSVELLDQILQLPGLDPNRPDNEGNTPLHFAAQAGQVECLNVLLSRCKGIEIDARNNLGFTPLMKAALQGRNKCAKLLLFAGANPTLRDSGRGLRADQWARFCGRYVCADVIEKHARQRLLERSTSYGNWGGENDMGARVLLGKVVPVPQIPQPQHENNCFRLKVKAKKSISNVFRSKP
ncbi:hypothetical protein ILUMI_22773 [Ignelater luminosus]|uniref:Ankyrin repeat domain-containing protein 33B n=1 Tax=Ignelater luminosus TaxID=2038154 RepID=A0A8K0CF58_IGNLU|nr:hypothetical protein ILUMI_22773 [Ignelater luminosus]